MKFMETMSLTRKKFKRRYYQELNSELYTPSDEAYVLVILWSQWKLWDNQKIDKESGLKVSTGKENCLSSSNGRGWSKEEIKLYRKVVDKIKAYCREETSIILEQHWNNIGQMFGGKRG